MSMPHLKQNLNGARRARVLALVALLWMANTVSAETPKLNIQTKNHLPQEEQRKEQMERLARTYDLKKYTITRDIVIDRGAINHSAPVLTLNLRFLDDDDLALSAYLHEQGHWLLMKRARPVNQALLHDLEATFPGLDVRPPAGDGELQSSYFHIAVCMLEWQAMEDLVGEKRARRVIEWKQKDHYTAIYEIVLQHRSEVESALNRSGLKW